MNNIQLSKEELAHLDYLAQILDFGAQELQTKVKEDTHNHLQNFLLYSFVPIHNFCESIYVLCKDSRPHAAQVLLRSVYEAYTNIQYVKNSNTEKRLALFAKDSFKSRKSLITELEIFVKKYPHLQGRSGLLEKDNIDSLKEMVDRNIKSIDLANGVEKEEYPKHFIDRVRQLDKETAGDEVGMHELNYHVLYRQLSLFTHLNAWGLEEFAEQGDESMIYKLGQEIDTEMIITIVGQVYLYYFDLLDNLYIHKIIHGEVLRKFREKFNDLKGELTGA